MSSKNRDYKICCLCGLLIFVILALFLSGCATMFQDVKINNAINQGRLRFGMTKQEVAKVIGSPMAFDVKTYSDEKGI